jgi:hypothetical protein
VHRQQVVLLERFDKLTDVRFCPSAVDPKLTCELFRDLWLRRALLQEFEDSRSDEVEAEHLAVEDVEDDTAILAVRGPYVFCDSHDFESFPQFAVRSDSTDIATCGV